MSSTSASSRPASSHTTKLTRAHQRSSALKRLMSELAEERRNPTPLIHLNFDESNLQRVTALIVGPHDTPYAGGFFRFLIKVPDGYPHCPPDVRLETTDGGRVRFNPNLYACGKVCLSILGTWTGPPWNSTHTLSSVLLSIQSLMNAAAIRNEPGLCDAGDDQVTAYNYRVAYQTLRVAVVGAIRSDRTREHSFFSRVYDTHVILFAQWHDAHFKSLRDALLNPNTQAAGMGNTFEVCSTSTVGTAFALGPCGRSPHSISLADLDALHADIELIQSQALARLTRPARLTASSGLQTSDPDSSDSEGSDPAAQPGPSPHRARSTSHPAPYSASPPSQVACTYRAEERTAYSVLSRSRDVVCDAGCLSRDEADASRWTGSVFGPIGTPYEGGVFPVELTFPRDFPARAPFVMFVQDGACRVLHPNVTPGGVPLVPELVFEWRDNSPTAASFGVVDVLVALANMLQRPSLSCVVNEEVANIFVNDRRNYNRMVREAIGV